MDSNNFESDYTVQDYLINSDATLFWKSSAPSLSKPVADTVTKLAPNFMNSATPAASDGELPPTPTFTPAARIFGITLAMTFLTSSLPGLPMLCPRSEAATL